MTVIGTRWELKPRLRNLHPRSSTIIPRTHKALLSLYRNHFFRVFAKVLFCNNNNYYYQTVQLTFYGNINFFAGIFIVIIIIVYFLKDYILKKNQNSCCQNDHYSQINLSFTYFDFVLILKYNPS